MALNFLKNMLPTRSTSRAANGSRRPRLFQPRLEALEDRTVPSTITWINRGTTQLDSDGFKSTFGNGAAAARNVVDAAINFWQKIITDFNQPFGGNSIPVTISMSPIGTGNGAFTITDAAPFTGLPLAGAITISRGGDLNNADGLGLGDGGGWFIDPTPTTSAEFNSSIVNAFVGNAPAGTPAGDGADLFSTVAHELGHVMGIYFTPGLHYHSSGFSHDTGIADNSVTGGGNGTYWVFDGPSVNYLMTSNNAGVNGQGFPLPLHSANVGDPAFPITFEGQQFVGVADIMNSAGPFGQRTLISNAIALVLKDAYGYDVVEPERFGTFHALLSSTGNLLIRGGTGASSDDIRLSRDGNELVVSVNLGTDVPGVVLGSTNAFVSRFLFSGINSITIQSGGGEDSVSLDFTEGDVIPTGGFTYDGGAGTDHINATANADFVFDADALQALTIGAFGSVVLTSIEDTNLTGGNGANRFVVNGWFGTGSLNGGGGGDTLVAVSTAGNFSLSNAAFDRPGRGRLIPQNIEQANLTGGADNTEFTVSGWTGGAILTGGGGLNKVIATDNANFTLTNTLLTSSIGGSFTLQSVTRAALTGGASANTFTVGWTGNVELNGAEGGDEYIVNLTGSAVSISFGAYQINDLGTSGSDGLTVNGTKSNDTLTVRKNTILRGFQTVVNYTGVDRLRVNADEGTDTVKVETTSTPLIVNTGLGNDTVNLGYTRSITPSSTDFSIPESVTVDGSTGTTDTVNVSFNFDTDNDLTVNRLTGLGLGGDELTYSNVERLNLTFGANSDILDVLATAAAVTTTINTGGGNDRIRLGGSTVNSIRGPLVIDGGANAVGAVDTLTLQEFEPAGLINQGTLGTPVNAGPGVGFLGGFGMGGPNNNVKFSNIESVQIISGPSNDFVSFLFASAPRFAFNLSLDGGNDGVVFQGTRGNDRIHISRQIGLDGPEVVAQINGQTIVAGYQGGDTISVFAGAGNDHVSVDASVTTWQAELFGQAGNDYLFGGALDDLLDGGSGHDYFDGGAGTNRIRARDDAIDVIVADFAALLPDLDPTDIVIRRRHL